MSSKQHDKQVARARGKRRASKQERRAARNRVIIIIMAALMVLSLFGTALIGVLGNRGSTDAQGAAQDSDPATQADAADAADAVGPCGPTPDDVPTIDSALYDEPFELTIDEDAVYVATIDTTCGEIVVELDAANAPLTTNNFVNLAEDGYYDGVTFHRVIPNFVAQAGDPEGSGGSQYPGYTFEDELAVAEELYAEVQAEVLAELQDAGQEIPEGTQIPAGYPRGTLAMANAGANTNGSQFFITQGDPTLLPGPLYSVFGQVVEGLEVLDAIVASPTAAGDRPLEDIVIRSVTIEQR